MSNLMSHGREFLRSTLVLILLALPFSAFAKCPPDEPPPCDPVTPPARPKPPPPSSIAYPSYTNGTSLTVTWPSVSVINGSPTYTLQEQANNGTWATIYTGTQTSRLLTGKSKSIFTYRVRTCRVDGASECSDYRTGIAMAVNPKLQINLYTKYPMLTALDQRVAAFKARFPSIATVTPRVPVNGRIDPNEERFYLGEGFDLIRHGIKELCLNTEHPDITIIKGTPNQPSSFSFSHVMDNRHLAQLLEVSASASVSYKDDDVSLGLSGEKERYRSAVTDNTHERFVVKIVRRAELWRLQTPADSIDPSLVNGMLVPGSAEARADFRERCGDQFINSVNVGAALYLVFDYDTKKFDSDTRDSKKGQFNAALGQIFSGSGAGSISSSTEQLISELQVTVRGDQVGGPPDVATSITAQNFNVKYNEFIQGINPSNYAAVDYTTTNYPRPAVYSAYSHDQIFADFTEPYAQARRWIDIIRQQTERCEPYTEHSRTRPPACGTAETELGIALDTCRETRDWVYCQHPAQYYPIFSSLPPTNLLLGWLNANVRQVNAAGITQNYTHHTDKAWLDTQPATLDVNDMTCLSHSQCFVNKFRGSGPGIGQGFDVTRSAYNNQHDNGGTEPAYSLANLDQCVNTVARLRTGGFMGPTSADFNYTINVYGFCADPGDFSVGP